jgi:shikimate dehydrogenase
LKSRPYGYPVSPEYRGASFDNHILRRLSDLPKQFADRQAYQAMLDSGDPLVYEVFENRRPETAGELLSGLSIVHPGRVGNEYFMTKGHYHAVRETAEIYYCLEGKGVLVMENEAGETAVEEFSPGRVVYVTPGWAHRSVNTGAEDLVTFFVYPGHSGHDYASIESAGFRKRVVEQDGVPTIVEEARRPRMFFIGVSTRQSSIMKVFPLWMRELGRPEVLLEGMDLQLHDDAANYRRAVTLIKEDPLCLGALVTTHKINLLKAARDLFEYLDPLTELSGEISCISKRGGRLEGHAKDPITGGMSLGALVGPGYFGHTGGQVLSLGAGGSTTALVLHFSRTENAADRPRRMVIVNRSPGRIEALRQMASALATGIEFEYHCHQDPRRNDELMQGLPPGSVVINATGMGKDLPGSPITDAGRFPMNGIAWELNYRGELQFLNQALAQREARNLTVEDGWVYFLHGWTQVIAQVLDIRLDEATFGRLAALAEPIRPLSRTVFQESR